MSSLEDRMLEKIRADTKERGLGSSPKHYKLSTKGKKMQGFEYSLIHEISLNPNNFTKEEYLEGTEILHTNRTPEETRPLAIKDFDHAINRKWFIET